MNAFSRTLSILGIEISHVLILTIAIGICCVILLIVSEPALTNGSNCVSMSGQGNLYGRIDCPMDPLLPAWPFI